MARASTNSDVFNAIAEPQRRRILTLLRTGERPATEIAEALSLAPSPTSKHLRVLREVGLVRVREEGRQRHYTLDARGLNEVHEWTGGFERFWSESFDRLDEYVAELKREESDDADG
jgi:DNA-binding transcriptional ArsR family regulator